MRKTFRIDCFPESALRCTDGFAVVAIDVIRATTTAVTAAALGRRCYPVRSLEDGWRVANRLSHPLLAGEVNGIRPAQFDLNNSPAALFELGDGSRPMVLLSSAGTRLMVNAVACNIAYVACFRNALATADKLISENYSRVALLGAGTRNEFREEDQIGCAWIGAQLVRAGYEPENHETGRVLKRWADAKPADCLVSKSVEYLRRSNQMKDLHFILEHINDLDDALVLHNHQVDRSAPAFPCLGSNGARSFDGTAYTWPTLRHRLLF
jgi:2-phosphosulfolactate phosphatase